MDTLTNQETDSNAGKRFRLTVKSAEEAVRNPKSWGIMLVLSVRQIGGEGFKRFSIPKL